MGSYVSAREVEGGGVRGEGGAVGQCIFSMRKWHSINKGTRV